MKRLWWFLFCCLALVAQPTLALTTDPPTCQLNNKNGLVNQTLCYGETVKIKATSSDENATLQWYRQQNSGNGWVAVTGATQSELTTGPGIYKAIFTFGDNSTCETNVDTVSYWKAYQIDWEVAACRASISGVTPLPFPAQLIGASEINTPIDSNAEITYSWQVIPTPVQASFTTSSNSIFPLTDGFFQDTTLGLHQVILTISQQGSSCISQDTMAVTLLPLNVWADTIISYGGQPAIAVAHASGGTEPYTYTWSSVDTCLSGNCDSVRLARPDYKRAYTVEDHSGCSIGGLAMRNLVTNQLSGGWGTFLPDVFQYSLVCGDSLTGEIWIRNKAVAGHLVGSANPFDSLEISSPNQNKQWELLGKLIDLKYFIEIFEYEGSVWTTMEGPRFVRTDNTIFINDTITFSGDSTHLFSISSKKKIIFGSGAYVKYVGVNPNQVLFYSTGGIEVHSQKGISPGILISEGDIVIFSNKSRLRGCYSMTDISLKTIEEDYFTDIASPLSTDAQILSFGCNVGVADNGYSLICNGGFEEVESGGQSGPIPASANLRGWGFSGSNGTTPDLYWKSENCFSPRPCGGCFGLPTNSMSRTKGIQPFENRCIGMYSSSPWSFGGEYLQTDLISPTIQNNYYFINLFASPATSMERKTKQVSLQLTNQDNAFYPIVFGSNSNHPDFLINGQWKELFRFFRADGAFSRLGLGDVQNAPSRNNPDFDDCERHKDRSYTYYDAVGLYRMPRVRPDFQIPCSTATFTFTLYDPDDQEAINGLVEVLLGMGISFEWRKGTQVISQDYFAAVSSQNAPAQFPLFALYNGTEANIGSVTVTLQQSATVQFTVTPLPVCPGVEETFAVVNPDPALSYSWAFSNGDPATGTGSTAISKWTTEGIQTVILTVNNPNDPNFCPSLTQQEIPVWNLPASITVKDFPGNPIVVCEEIEELELFASLYPDAISYTWLNVTDPTNPITLGVTSANSFMLTLPEIDPANGVSAIRVRVIIQFGSGCLRVGELEIIRYANPFNSPMQIQYQNNSTAGTWTPLNTNNLIELCSGTETLFRALFEGSANPGAVFTWNIGQNTTVVEQQILVAGWPEGNYPVQVRATDGHGNPCFSPFVEFEIRIINPKNLAITPIPIAGYPNDFDLQASFDVAELTSLSLQRAGQTQLVGNQVNGLLQLNIYQPGNSFPTIPICRPDGIYSFLATYEGGCISRQDFTLIGRKGMFNSTYTSQKELTGSNQIPLSGTVYMHHNVHFNSGAAIGNLRFTGANVFVRGETQTADPCLAPTGYVCPEEEVTGTYLTISGANTTATISNSEFQAIGILNRMWGGIKVNGINSLRVGNFAASPFENRISDAFTGLEIGSSPCSTLNIIGARFENCFRGLVCNSTIASTSPFTSFIKNCWIGSNPLDMKKPYHPRSSNPNHQFITQTGILLQGTSRFPLLNNGGPMVATFSGHTIQNCMEGLVVARNDADPEAWPANATDCIDVHNCSFTNIWGSGISSWGGVRRISGCSFSINGSIPVYSNYQPGRPVAILGQNASMEITGNTLTASNHGAIPVVDGMVEKADGGSTHTLSITGNTFTDLATAISLERQGGEDPAFVDLTMRCNNFEQPTAIPTGQERVGLRIGEGVVFPGNQIGGDNGATVSGSPNANRWPLSSLTWTSMVTPTTIDGFVSIENQTVEDIDYWRYNNEFFGTVSNTNGGSVVPNVLSPTVVNYVYSALDWCQISGNNCGIGAGPSNLAPCITAVQTNNSCPGYTFPTGITWTRVCEESPVDLVEWPFFARASQSNGEVTSATATEVKPDLQLGQSQPNPGKTTIQIPYFLPVEAGRGELWITEVSTGRLVEILPVHEIGAGKLEINLSGYANGIFAYKLMPEKGKASPTLRFVVIR